MNSGRPRSGGFLAARDNPFRAERIESVPYRFATGSWTDHLGRLADAGFHGAILGPQGTGKTTLLEQLRDRLPSIGATNACFIDVDRTKRDHAVDVSHWIEKKRGGTIMLIDGIERMSWSNRRRLMRSARLPNGGLLVTCHRRCRLPVWIECRSTPDTLHYVLSMLLPEVDEDLWQDALRQFHACKGNLRDVLRHLYDRFADDGGSVHSGIPGS